MFIVITEWRTGLNRLVNMDQVEEVYEAGDASGCEFAAVRYASGRILRIQCDAQRVAVAVAALPVDENAGHGWRGEHVAPDGGDGWGDGAAPVLADGEG